MGKFPSIDREGGKEAGIFLLNIFKVEKLFSKIMKKFKSKSFSPCDPCALSPLHKLKENGTMEVLAAITKQVNEK